MCQCGGGGGTVVSSSGGENTSPGYGNSGFSFMGKSILFWLVVAILVISLLTYMEVGRG